METENRAPRHYYADPTADTAIGNVMRKNKLERMKKDAEQRKLIIADLSAVVKNAKKMNCKTVSFKAVPIGNIKLVLAALRG